MRGYFATCTSLMVTPTYHPLHLGLPKLLFHARTLYLFFKSDVKTTLIPVSLLAFAATPICATERISRGFQAAFWLFMHLLQFNLSNQLYSVEEDKQNHSYRPLAANRISFRAAFLLRWASTVACLAQSLYYGPLVFFTSFMSALFAFMYNETSLHKHWIFRASFNSLGYGAFKLGTMLVCGCDRNRLDSVASSALVISMGIIWTTVYVQDFQDVEGDGLINRATLPLVYPNLSRAVILPVLLGWSLLLSYVWELSAVLNFLFVVSSILIALRFITYRSVEADKISYNWYNLWLGICFLLPGYHRSLKTL